MELYKTWYELYVTEDNLTSVLLHKGIRRPSVFYDVSHTQ